jgi:1,4-dihydroxy-2-naphthoyl-CoA hydrolase
MLAARGRESLISPPVGFGRMADDPRGLHSHFDALVGTQWLDDDPDHARVRIELRDELRQPVGLLHGGVISTLVESVCSRATALVVMDDGMMAMGQSIGVDFIRPVTAGAAEVKARARHRGRTTWVWDAQVLNDDGKLCALAQMTIAVRPIPKG